jgi:uncharacterized membrane protein
MEKKKTVGIIFLVMGLIGLAYVTITAASLYTGASQVSPNPLRDILGLLVGLYVIPAALTILGIWFSFIKNKKKF